MTPLTGAQRTHLRGLAHHLKPVVQIGKQGFSENVKRSIDAELLIHELIKIKFVEFKEEKRAFARDIEAALAAQMVGLVGNIAIFYRPHPEPGKRHVRLR